MGCLIFGGLGLNLLLVGWLWYVHFKESVDQIHTNLEFLEIFKLTTSVERGLDDRLWKQAQWINSLAQEVAKLQGQHEDGKNEDA